MKEEGLNKVIEILERNSSEDDAYFEYTYDEETEETYVIKSNKDGLKTFALELLKIANSFSEFKNNDKKFQPIKLDVKEWFIGDEVMPTFIEPLFINRNEMVVPKPFEHSWKDDFFGFGLILFLTICVVLAIIGFITLIGMIL